MKVEAEGKIWLEPQVTIAYMHHFSVKEVRQIMTMVTANAELFKHKWNEHFTK
ncbi:MAG: DUF4160 domain-containing protein [Flavisolibacter sp.]|nr:DUF4160 domain-containing protein [Flavisolibacter sp.]MBD0368573.1 DUF4160 domain-containing protein [Flavisolibacter sp.]